MRENMMRCGRGHLGLGLLLAVWLVFPGWVAGLQFEPLSIEEMTRHADLILRGVVQSKTCLRDGRGRIYTKVELSVRDIWKGAISGSPFLVVHGGGVLGEERATVSGQVQYELGEEVVVFLVRNERGEGVTVGLFQGKFHVREDAVSHRKLASSPIYGAEVKPPPGRSSPLAPGDRSFSMFELEALKRRVMEVR